MLPKVDRFPERENRIQISPEAQVRTMQIIVCALILGVVILTAVACFIVLGAEPPLPPEAGELPVEKSLFLVYFGAAFAGLNVILRFVVPGFVAQGAINQSLANRPLDSITKDDFYQSYLTSLIVASALLEGAALLNVIAFILEHQILSLGIVGGLVLLLAAGFPTRDRVDGWAEVQLRNTMLSLQGQ